MLKRWSWERTQTFQHNLMTFPDLPDETTDGGRRYYTPIGWLPSVTTVLGEDSKNDIARWIAWKGEDEARKITDEAKLRGSAIHRLCEKYLLNEDLSAENRYYMDQFKVLQPILDKYVNRLIAIEAPLWSKRLEVAGRTDCIADWGNAPAIIDFKTSLKPKERNRIKHYFMQAACYSAMFEELTGIIVNKIVVVIAVDGAEPQIFIEERDDHLLDFINVRNKYKEKFQC